MAHGVRIRPGPKDSSAPHWRYRPIAAMRHLAHFFQCVADKNMRRESGFCGFLLNLVKVH
jgi:hypothetical protein